MLWGNKNYDFYYLPILKNAQTWGKYFFNKNFNFVFLNNEIPYFSTYEKKVIVFYRDPILRWFSGVAEWFSKRLINGHPLPKDYKIDQLMMQIIFSAGKIDDHTKLQREAFAGISYDNCIFFDVGDINFTKNLMHYFVNVQKIQVNFTNIEKINILEEYPLKVNIKNQLLEAFNANKKFKEQLLQNFNFDLESYEMLKNKKMFYIAEH